MNFRFALVFGLLVALVGDVGGATLPKPKPVHADDAIADVLRGEGPSPAAKPLSTAPTGHTSAPSLPPPIIMGVRIGEHQDRTRFVVEISDPFIMRTFTLSGP